MFPRGQHFHQLFRDLTFFQEHPEHLVPEDGLQLLNLQRRGDAEHASVTVKAAVRQEDVAVGIETEEVAESLDGNDCAG